MKSLLTVSVLAIVLSAACVTGSASAQTTGPGGQPSYAVSDAQLEASLRELDPQLQIERRPNGETIYRLQVRIDQEVRPLIVVSSATKIAFAIPLSKPFRPTGTNVESLVQNVNQKIKPSMVVVLPNSDGTVVLVAMTEMDRPISVDGLTGRVKQLVEVVVALTKN